MKMWTIGRCCQHLVLFFACVGLSACGTTRTYTKPAWKITDGTVEDEERTSDLKTILKSDPVLKAGDYFDINLSWSSLLQKLYVKADGGKAIELRKLHMKVSGGKKFLCVPPYTPATAYKAGSPLPNDIQFLYGESNLHDDILHSGLFLPVIEKPDCTTFTALEGKPTNFYFLVMSPVGNSRPDKRKSSKMRMFTHNGIVHGSVN